MSEPSPLRKVSRVVGTGPDEEVSVLRYGDSDAFMVYADDADAGCNVHCTADALAQLVCDLGAHVGPVADRVTPHASWFDVTDACAVMAPEGRVVADALNGTPQEVRRLALTLLVAAAVAEQQAGEV